MQVEHVDVDGTNIDARLVVLGIAQIDGKKSK